MSVSTIPPIAVGSDKWEEISSTTASGSTVSFTSISGYRKLALDFKDITNNAATLAGFSITINNDTGSNYLLIYNTGSAFSVQGAQGAFSIGSLSNGYTLNGSLQIDNCDSSKIKNVIGGSYSSNNYTYVYFPGTYYKGSATVSSVEFKGSSMTGGTVTLYGVRQ